MSTGKKTTVTLTITGTMVLSAIAWASRSDTRISRSEQDILEMKSVYSQTLTTLNEIKVHLGNIEGRMSSKEGRK
jgi:hypothetical protein